MPPIMIALLMLHSVCSLTSAKRVPAHADSGDLISPDHKFVAHVASDTAALCLWIYPIGPHGAQLLPRDGLIGEIIDVDGYLWAPNKPHLLVFATSSVYGQASLATWNGERRTRPLIKVKHPDQEYFILDSITADGQTLFYRHGAGDQTEDQYRRKSLRLTSAPLPLSATKKIRRRTRASTKRFAANQPVLWLRENSDFHE